jgi:hypothetical protein
LSKKALIGILIAAGLVYLLTRSKPAVQTTPTVVSSASDSTSPANEPKETSTTTPNPRTFAGDPCTSDCSGHEAGYNWADEKGIDDESDCDTAGDTSNSPSFAEGCRDYVRGNEPDDHTDDDPDN